MLMQPITIRYSFRPKTRSLATGQVVDLFGLTDAEAAHVVAENVTLDIRPGDLVLFTGPSGSGKSSLLRAASERLGAIDVQSLALPEKPLVDALDGPIERRLQDLAACGLSEARLMLRTPAELSDGQRYRFRLAYALAQAGRGDFLLADEFAALLDRTLAKVVAFNVRKRCSRTGVGFLLATAHDDLSNDLNPNLHVRMLGDGAISVERRDVKKKRLVSHTSFGCRAAPVPTGRILLGGIIAATPSPLSAASSCSGMAATRSASACSAVPPRG